MRVFFSHCNRDKPLLREIKHHLPSHVKPWIDESELLIGENIIDSIRKAISRESDFVVIFIGPEAVRSEWVNRELEWALTREREIKRIFVLPIVLDEESWQQLPEEFRFRKFLLCRDFTEAGVRDLATRLSNELFALLSRHNSRSDDLTEIDRDQRKRRIREIAENINDDQTNCKSGQVLSKERLELIIYAMEPFEKVELLSLYEIQFGKFKTQTLGEGMDNAKFLRIEFKIGNSDTFTHKVDWSPRPFFHLHQNYGLGNNTYDVRDVFLAAIGKLNRNERRKMFLQIEIRSCSFER